jgi:hypothetical protein
MHNSRLSDADNEFTKQIKEITDKGTNQTKEDKEHLAHLEWQGSLYTNGNNIPVIPSANFIKMLREAAAVTKEGKKIARGLSPLALTWDLEYGGPKNLKELYAIPAFVDRRQVKVGRGLIKRTRPIFPQWKVTPSFELLTDILDFGRLKDLIELAGLTTGLGDARILGYGRFQAKVTEGKS